MTVSIGVLSLPEVARGPAHPPLAVHAVALVVDQLSMDVLPLVTCVGVADSAIVGGGMMGTTVTTAE